MALAVFLLGGAVLAAALRWWRPAVSWRALTAYLALAAVFYAVPPGPMKPAAGRSPGAPRTLSALRIDSPSGRTGGPPIRWPTDIAYMWRPWMEAEDLGAGEPRNPLLTDPLLQMLPFRHVVRQRLLHGEAPLWAHELGTGQPLLGDAQSAAFAPLHLLALPLAPLQALPVAMEWQLFLALACTHALALALGGGRLGAAFAAVAFGLSTFSVGWACYPLGMAAAWVPGVMLGLVLLRRGERGGLSGLIVCGLGLALSGQPEILAQTALAAAPVVAALLATGGGVPRLRFLAKLGAAGALTACLAAPALLPVLAALPEAGRWLAVRRNPEPVWPPHPTARTASLVIDPLAAGSPLDGTWRGDSNWNELATGYAGLTALALAAAAALTLRRAALLLAGGAAALLVALRMPPLFHLVTVLPGVGNAAHGRMRLFWVLAVALAAGCGLDALAARRRGALAAAALCTAAMLADLLLPPLGGGWERVWWRVAMAGALLAAAAFALRPARRWAPLLAVAVLAVDLGALGWRFVPLVPGRFDLAPPAAMRYLVAATSAAPAPFRVLAEGDDLAPNLGALYGLWDPRGNDPMQPADALRVVGTAFRPHYRVGRPVTLPRGRLPQPVLDYLGVRYLLLGHRAEPHPPWQPVWDGEGGRIWTNPAALPLFFFPAHVQLAPGGAPGAAAAAVANPSFADLAFVDEPLTPARPSSGVALGGTAALRQITANGFVLDLVSAAGGLVVSSVSHAAGWRVTLDGRPARPLRVNGGFLGFLTPAGRHRAVLDYRPAAWPLGWCLCGCGAAALLATVILRLRRRPRAGH